MINYKVVLREIDFDIERDCNSKIVERYRAVFDGVLEEVRKRMDKDRLASVSLALNHGHFSFNGRDFFYDGDGGYTKIASGDLMGIADIYKREHRYLNSDSFVKKKELTTQEALKRCLDDLVRGVEERR